MANNVRILNKDTEVDIGEKEQQTGDISSRLQRLMLQIKGDFMSEEGRAVDYRALKTSELFMTYVKECQKLSRVDLAALENEERIAFFINIYNALTIHGICEQGVPKSVLEVKNFWNSIAYAIGGYVFTLDDIEHGILRGNRPHPSSPSPLFSETDSRLQFSMHHVDPRIHFALVCGAKSCPAINVYSSTNLDRGLKAATANFCLQEVQVHLKLQQVKLSKIFFWYRNDFGKTDVEILRWILPYLSEQLFHDLEELVQECEKGEATISVCYGDYNWNLNNISNANLS